MPTNKLQQACSVSYSILFFFTNFSFILLKVVINSQNTNAIHYSPTRIGCQFIIIHCAFNTADDSYHAALVDGQNSELQHVLEYLSVQN